MTSQDNIPVDDEDVEGHRVRPGLLPEDSDDDVEGHQLRPGR